MASKYTILYAHFFIQDTATGLGVAGKTASTDYTSIKLVQDGVLGADVKASITINDLGGGFYSFALTALQANYDTILPVGVSVTATYQVFGYQLVTSKIDNAVGFLGLATAGGNNTVTLASDPYGADNFPNGSIVEIVGGTGKGQNRTIIGYVYSTKVVTVGRNWVTNPSTDSIIMIKQLNCARVDANLNVYSVDSAGAAIATASVLGTPAGASIAADLAEIEGETDGIASIPTTPLLAANYTAPDNASIAALLAALSPISGSVNDASATTLHFVSNLSSAVDDFYKGIAVVFTSGTLTGQLGQISAYTGSSKLVTLQSALTSAPANAVTFRLVNVAASRKLAAWLAATVGADNKTLISSDAQDLSGTLGVNAKVVNGVAPLITETGKLEVAVRSFIDNSDVEKNVELGDVKYPKVYAENASGLSAQQVRDAMALATSATIAEGSIDDKIDDMVGSDGRALISSDAQDLSGTLSVNAKKLNAATPNNAIAAPKFPDGFVYADPILGSAGTTYPLGEATTPTSNIPDAITIAAANLLTRLGVRGVHNLSASISAYEFEGIGPTGGQSVDKTSIVYGDYHVTDSAFKNIQISGVGGSGYLASCDVRDSHCISIIANDTRFFNCRFLISLATRNSLANLYLHGCVFGWEANALDVALDATNYVTALNMLISNCEGRLSITNLPGAGGMTIVDFNGKLTIDSSSAGTIQIFGGSGTVINNSASATVTYNGISVANGTTLNIPAKVSDASGLTAQQVRDAMTLPTFSAVQEGSIDGYLQELVEVCQEYPDCVKDIILDSGAYYFVVYNPSTPTIYIVKRRLEKFGGGNIVIAGTTTPSRMGINAV
jgi:hypothetical protein